MDLEEAEGGELVARRVSWPPSSMALLTAPILLLVALLIRVIELGLVVLDRVVPLLRSFKQRARLHKQSAQYLPRIARI